MNDEIELRIVPEATGDDRAAILAAVEATLRREAELARPAPWRLSGWTGQRVGIVDLAPRVSPTSLWPLSVRLGWGGRTFPGLIGRGDAR